jgi:hypothetical protein
MTITIVIITYILQTILGAYFWYISIKDGDGEKINKTDLWISIVASLMIIPNLILLAVILDIYLESFISALFFQWRNKKVKKVLDKLNESYSNFKNK